MTALIHFTQAGNTDTGGRAVKGTTTDGVVTVANTDDTGVASWKFEVLYAPPGSAVPLTVQGPNATPTFAMPQPDVPGTYRVRLTTYTGPLGTGTADVDIRCFGVPFPNGIIAPPFQGAPNPPLPLTGPGSKPHECNYAGQAFGWDGVDDVNHAQLYQTLKRVLPLGTVAGHIAVWDGTKWTEAAQTTSTIPDLSITAAKLVGGGVANRVALTLNGTNVIFDQVNLTTQVQGVLPVLNGGTGQSNFGTGVLHVTDGTPDVISSSLIVNADITPATINLDKLAQSGATPNQVIAWSGTAWVPTTAAVTGVPAGRTVSATAPILVNGGAGPVVLGSNDVTISIGQINLATGVTGVLPVVNGGTGQSDFGTGVLHVVNGTPDVISSSLIVNADITNATIDATTKIAPGPINTFLSTNGSSAVVWVGITSVPAVGGNGTILTVVTGAPAWVAAGGDVIGPTSALQVVGLTGTTGVVAMHATQILIDQAVNSPSITQTDRVAGNGQTLLVRAQNATAGSTTGGSLVLSSGSGTSAAGTVDLAAAGVLGLRLNANGTITIPNLTGGGVVLAAAGTGNLSAGQIIDANVATGANIAVAKLAPGTPGQVLTTVAGIPNVATWALITNANIAAVGVANIAVGKLDGTGQPDGNVVTVIGGVVQWGPVAGASLPQSAKQFFNVADLTALQALSTTGFVGGEWAVTRDVIGSFYWFKLGDTSPSDIPNIVPALGGTGNWILQ